MAKPVDELQQLEMITVRTSPSKPLTRTGQILMGITGASFLAITAITTPFIMPAWRRVVLPYVPATTQQVQNVLSLLRGRSGRLVDLGSGDGRIVLEAARRGFRAEGIELNPWLVWYSRYRAARDGITASAKFYRRNIWKYDLKPYNNIVIFGVDSMMEPLREKLSREIGESCHVVACRFPILSCAASESVGAGLDTVWLYTKSDLTKQANMDNTEESKLKQRNSAV